MLELLISWLRLSGLWLQVGRPFGEALAQQFMTGEQVARIVLLRTVTLFGLNMTVTILSWRF
jgi:hypothetical protein